MKTSVYLAVLSACSLQAAAHQHASVPHSGDPPRSSSALYDSAFRGYMPWQEPKLAAWKELNDEVHRVGGHVGIVRGDSAHGAKDEDRPSPTSAPARIPAARDDAHRVHPRSGHDKATEPAHKHGGRQ